MTGIRSGVVATGIVMVVLFGFGKAVQGGPLLLSSVDDAWGDVRAYRVSPTGTHAVFSQDYLPLPGARIFSVELSSGALVEVGACLSGAADPFDFSISPDGSTVVFQDSDASVAPGLYSAPIGGPSGICTRLDVGGGVLDHLISPDSSRVVFRQNTFAPSAAELFSVPVGGPAASGSLLTPPMVSGSTVGDFGFSSDSQRVVFISDAEVLDRDELFVVGSDGTPAVAKLSDTLPMNGSVFDFVVSPDNARVIYRADLATQGTPELFSVAIGGPANSRVQLNPTLDPGRSVNGAYRVTSDSLRVVYRADQEVNNRNELYSAPIAGPSSQSVKLHATLPATGDVLDFDVSPDGTTVVFRGDVETGGVQEVFSVAVAGPGTSAQKLNDVLVENGDVDGFRISPDSERVVYRADAVIEDLPTGWVNAIDGQPGDAELVWIGLSADLRNDAYAFVPGGRSVVVVRNKVFIDGIDRLWQQQLVCDLDVDGRELTPIGGFFSGVVEFEVAPNGSWVVYLAQQGGLARLYRVDLPIFEGGFESGDTSCWPTVVP